jgi:adenosylcobinamide kinase/adenosylcobinamide-phosphate guanylyltransferase
MPAMDKLIEGSRVTFVFGGARSGKSRFSQKLGESFPGKKLFIATAQPLDDEMRKRIEGHRASRGKKWETVEEPLEISKAIREGGNEYGLILIDCLTIWISNLLEGLDGDEEKILEEVRKLEEAIKESDVRFIIVSNEVGMGIVPDNKMARQFRELLGMVNQRMAELSDRVILMASGVPMVLKGQAH